jgi:Glycosyl transferase family 2
MALKIAVITPYYKEPVELLKQCHDSVMTQGVDATHFMVADGHPLPELAGWPIEHVVLNRAHADYGNTPRGVGGALARSQGFDFVTYLDADNWYHPGHLRSLMAIHEQTGADVCCTSRTFHRPDQSQLSVEEALEESRVHVDTNCLMLSRAAYEVLDVWLQMPKQLAAIGDRVVFASVRHRRFKVAHTQQRTVAYRTLHANHYHLAGEALPPDVKQPSWQPCVAWLQTQQGVVNCQNSIGFWPKPYLTA